MKKLFFAQFLVVIFMILGLALSIKVDSQSIKSGVIVYQTRRTLRKEDFGPNTFLFSALNSSFLSRNSKIVFKNVLSVFYETDNLTSTTSDLKNDANAAYRNTDKFITVENKTKLKKNYSLITPINNNLLKLFTESKMICGYPCTKMAFSDENGNQTTGWVTKKLPSSAGCVIVKNVPNAILSYEGKRDTCIAVNLQPNINIADSYLLPPKTDREVINYNSSLYATNQKINLNELRKFPDFKLYDLDKHTVTNKIFDQDNVTALIFWNNIDLAETFGSKMAMIPRDFDLVKDLDLFAQRNKVDLLLLAITEDNPEELEFTNPDVRKLKKTLIIPQAFNWIKSLNVSSYPTIILVDKAGLIRKIINYTNGDDELHDLEQNIMTIGSKAS